MALMRICAKRYMQAEIVGGADYDNCLSFTDFLIKVCKI